MMSNQRNANQSHSEVPLQTHFNIKMQTQIKEGWSSQMNVKQC